MSTTRCATPARLAGKFWPMVILLIVMVTGAMVLSSASPRLDSGTGAAIEGTWEMALAFAPVLRFSSGERTFPVPVEYFMERSSLVDLAGTVRAEGPEATDLEEAGPLQFLDFEAEDVISSYEEDRPGIAPTVYGRVAEVNGRVVLQYWSFYVFNQGRLNSHEGDWEMVQVTLCPDGKRADTIALSQHHSGSVLSWDSLTEVVDGTHPVVWVSLGSHANYEAGAQRLAYGDHADGEGEEWAPEDYSLVPIGTGAEGSEPVWLRYEGAWGAPAGSLGGMLGREGPKGPMFREDGTMWAGVDWWS